MNIFVLEIWDDEASKCTFYTVRKEELKMSETDKFFKKYNAIAEFKKPTQELLSFILALRNKEILVDYKKRRIYTNSSDEEIIL